MLTGLTVPVEKSEIPFLHHLGFGFRLIGYSSQEFSNGVHLAALDLNFDRLIEKTLKPAF